MKGIKTSFITKEELPLVIEPTESLSSLQRSLELLRHHEKFCKESLLKYGGILLRNFPFSEVDHFADVISTMNIGSCVDYIGGDSPRIKIKGNIYTSTEAPPSLRIPLHNELSFVKNYPTHICFFCLIPAPEGGETIIADTRKVYKAIDDRVKQKFSNKGLKYVSRYYYKSKLIEKIARGHKTWIDVFETEDKKEVEHKCAANEFGFKWNKNDWLEVSQQRPAILEHPITKEKVWFNQAHLYDFNPKLLGWWKFVGSKIVYSREHMKLHEIFFGDTTPIPRPELYHILDVLDSQSIYFPWQKGDILILDNILAMHGRATFKGKRRILTAMTK